MSVDLAVLTPTYLDVTLVGLEALPGPGEEVFAGDTLRSPGGGGITAVGAVRLGLSAALVAPLGDDVAGQLVRTALIEEGVALSEPRGQRTPVTIVMPVGGERSMITVDPGIRARPADLAALEPRAVAATLEQVDLVPAGIPAYVTCGDDDARAFAGRLPHVGRTRALFANRRDARLLTGANGAEEAAQGLADIADTAVVTLGDEGAIAVVDGRTVTVPGVPASRVVDTTGAGDLFAAAFAWADLHGAEPEAAVRWANLYAALSVGAHTAIGGAVARERLLEEGAQRGLPRLPAAATDD